MPVNLLPEESQNTRPDVPVSAEAEEGTDLVGNEMLTTEENEVLGESFSNTFDEQLDLGLSPEEEKLLELLMDFDVDDLSTRAREVLTEVFHRFDVDKDGRFNDSELDAFAQVCNGEPFTEEEKEEILDTFECEDGSLLLEGFLNLYMLQSCARPLDTMTDLFKLGYDGDLEKMKNGA
eukprot:CFRG6873T1